MHSILQHLANNPWEILPYIGVGFVAQMVDGALGMAFGVISGTMLLSLGVPPAAASAGVHMVETFTTALSGISHTLHRNVRLKLLLRLVVPGMIGGALGAWSLSHIKAEIARPIVLVYLIGIACYLFWRSRDYPAHEKSPKVVEPLGLLGGFLGAIGGGGWGPVVTSNLLVQGVSPRVTIGTVNTAEFFVAIAIAGTFATQLGWVAFTLATAGLLIGGVIAAPCGAFLARRIEPKLLMRGVAAVLLATSLYNLYSVLHPAAH